MKRILTLFSALTAVMGLSLNASSMTTIKLLQTSDIHGNFFPYNFITRQPSAGSLARVYGAVKEARQRYGDDAIEGANARMMALTKDEWDAKELLEESIKVQLRLALT